ncbi:amino acid/amide ABC transporter ATP-binding protein 1 (HAAT family) [Kribbella amoyensis]|uniref:Amino acid/amide ABC transporter ATP-binding protein 1 (HAAT family) n=1 Tax=Kribbella amoyensis TaxID=996641 RepID=A0A561B8B8_9ACTN|nr:ABC transporter ATP-binding protein [Kribbella amoyensis]TWD75093.1 amino acid/amide ABC transporter ATP-binding protein 1 (HAAT family) [Kribbella amoyensis]
MSPAASEATIASKAGQTGPALPEGSPPLEVRGLVKRFAGVTALAGVDLRAGRREILGLVGPNGSGKTTLMNCISGVHRLDEGQVLLQGEEISGRPSRARARQGICRTFQNLKLFGELTVWENVQVGANAVGGRGARPVPDWLDLLRLGPVADAVVRSLPYGYQRRVELARALAGAPEVLLLDEPAAGLNDEETAELRELVLTVRAEVGCAIVIIDHDMDLVTGVSDRVQVLDEGRTLFEGDPRAAFTEQAVVDAYLGES